ncbi:YbaB/EbfC family nucleoid-associated protein [Gordonia sp. X0973]|uniref:YbaB/EbfC family nucleoid-associated protein n=1 Tax=Gordonia sp. X0973 TaxID=2742602 RepID=UPI000F5208C7|nr:YbaB/EbfC family nucleoid-associated protein [Gordonia sp. X0973]QKT08142.1 YbaB/EbfC family nucleoid-associated protein [Gordonia sp. X0973]
MANPQLDEILARVSTAVGRMADLSDGYAAIRAEAADPKGAVTARVDGSGALVGLELDHAAVRLGADALGESIVSTAMIAAQRAYAQRARLTEDFNSDFGEFAGIATDEGE